MKARSVQKNSSVILLVCFVDSIPRLNGLVLGHVLAFFGSSIPSVAFLVIDASVGIYPYFSISTTCRLSDLGG